MAADPERAGHAKVGGFGVSGIRGASSTPVQGVLGLLELFLVAREMEDVLLVPLRESAAERRLFANPVAVHAGKSWPERGDPLI